MTSQSLDTIVRNVLLRKNYSIHFYIDALIAARDCLRELNLDTLGIVNTKVIPLNDGFAAEIPADYCDWVEVAAKAGQFLRPLVPTNDINPLISRDSTGAIQTYGNSNTQDSSIFNSLAAGYFWRTVTWNQYGENVGRLFGFTDGYADTFQVFKERNQIQCNEQVGVTEIVLKYISDGMDADAASHVETYAIKTIEEYIMWQFKEMNRTYNDSEKERARQLYIKEYGILRARKADWSIARIKRIAQKASYSTGKA